MSENKQISTSVTPQKIKKAFQPVAALAEVAEAERLTRAEDIALKQKCAVTLNFAR